MAIIVQHRETKQAYIMLGTSYAAYVDSRSSFLGGALFPHRESGELPLAAVCSESGKIEWFLTEDLVVIEVDGQKLSEFGSLLPAYKQDRSSRQFDEYCPACQEALTPAHMECPSCGLVFPQEP
ncbi:hypothetical protein [Paenibacillus eucommiae]|uniref:Zinc ribbon domain-containing protein n=1 Tax=Paenibacillus eucommiae TaxID=1355755 RepID=A0ABS4INE4_9BACL|nr:hypothetical protein [Paenibacillus eucommiae]MBP1989093.1 hypothetical protein [Paenibacillus eucommiae]